MQTRLVIAGVLFIIAALTVHYLTSNFISQVDVIVSPMAGNMVCGTFNDNPTLPSQEITPTSQVDLFFHENICSTLSLVEKILEFSSISAGFTGTILVIFGGLTKSKTKTGQMGRNRVSA